MSILEAGMNDSNARPQAVGSAPHDAAAISLRDVAYDIARYLNDSSQSGGDRAYSVGAQRLFDGGMVMLEGTATDIDTMQAVPFILEIHGRTVQA